MIIILYKYRIILDLITPASINLVTYVEEIVLGGFHELQFNFGSDKNYSEINPGKLCVGDKKNKATYRAVLENDK